MFARVRPMAEESARIQAALLSPGALAAMTRMFGRPAGGRGRGRDDNDLR
jgi:hypothetical protein